ncbi:MAG: hypothetical protein ACLQUW_12735 [Desulfobaccales bacterium]
MSYNIDILKEKILEMYPELARRGVHSILSYDSGKQAYVLKLQKGVHELATYIDRPDADRCLEGQVCVALGIQIRQFLDNFEEEE